MIAALSFDYDDTLWPVMPALERAEQALERFLADHAPETLSAWPRARREQLRAELWSSRSDLQHDYSTLRRIALGRMLAGQPGGRDLVEPAFEAFFAGRNQVELYPEVAEVLDRLALRLPLVGLSNGNADLRRIGLDHHFTFTLSAREHGRAKPSPCIFEAVCRRLELPPEAILHIGDHPEHDVLGAREAGLKAAWINRDGQAWNHPSAPDLVLRNLLDLEAWLLPRLG